VSARGSGTMSRREALAILAAGAAVMACGRAPREARPVPIAIGRDECAWCRMPIDDARLAAEFVPRSGTPALFGEVGCLLSWRAANPLTPGTGFVTAGDTGEWLDARRATYALGATRTPMYFDITAHAAPPAGVPAASIVSWEILRDRGAPHARPG